MIPDVRLGLVARVDARSLRRLAAAGSAAATAALQTLDDGLLALAVATFGMTREGTPYDADKTRRGKHTRDMWEMVAVGAETRGRGRGFMIRNRAERTEAGQVRLRALEFGARPHKIRARRKKVLAFEGPDGETVFRREVNHPGNRPYAMVRLAREFAISGLTRLRRQVARAVADVWSRRGRG